MRTSRKAGGLVVLFAISLALVLVAAGLVTIPLHVGTYVEMRRLTVDAQRFEDQLRNHCGLR